MGRWSINAPRELLRSGVEATLPPGADAGAEEKEVTLLETPEAAARVEVAAEAEEAGEDAGAAAAAPLAEPAAARGRPAEGRAARLAHAGDLRPRSPA